MNSRCIQDSRRNLYVLNEDAIAQLDGQNPIFSPNRDFVVTYSNVGQVYLYDLNR